MKTNVWPRASTPSETQFSVIVQWCEGRGSHHSGWSMGAHRPGRSPAPSPSRCPSLPACPAAGEGPRLCFTSHRWRESQTGQTEVPGNGHAREVPHLQPVQLWVLAANTSVGGNVREESGPVVPAPCASGLRWSHSPGGQPSDILRTSASQAPRDNTNNAEAARHSMTQHSTAVHLVPPFCARLHQMLGGQRLVQRCRLT